MAELNSSLTGAVGKHVAQFCSMEDLVPPDIPVHEFLFQYLVGRKGIPYRRQIGIVGPTHIGKTTFTAWLSSWFARMGTAVLYMEGEQKAMDAKRFKDSMSLDPALSAAWWKLVSACGPRTLDEFHSTLHMWVMGVRNPEGTFARSLDRSIPVLAALDPFSKLMSGPEAEAWYAKALAIADEKEKKDKKEGKRPKRKKHVSAGDVTTFGHSKFAQQFSRLEGAFLEANNVNMIFTHHQNDNSPGKQMPGVVVSEMKNTTKIGGRGLDQTDTLTFVMGKYDGIPDIKRGDDIVGKKVRIRTHKNSAGIPERIIAVTIWYDPPEGAPVLDFAETTCEFLVKRGLLEVGLANGKWTCPRLGVKAASARDLHAALHDSEELMAELGRKFKIKGYDEYTGEDVPAEGVETVSDETESEEEEQTNTNPIEDETED
jgi:hypothetical protein